MEPTKGINSNLKQIYDLYRTSLLNAKYYGYQLERLGKLNTALELIIALGAISSGAGGFAYLQSERNQWIWATLAGLSALFATVKPILSLGEKIKRYTELWSGYQTNFISLKRLVQQITAAQALSLENLDRFGAIYDRHEKLAALDAVNPSRKLIERFQAEVNTALPSKSFWWCKTEAAGNKSAAI